MWKNTKMWCSDEIFPIDSHILFLKPLTNCMRLKHFFKDTGFVYRDLGVLVMRLFWVMVIF